MINHGDQSAIVAGFAVNGNALSEIDFLKPLGLTDVAVVYVSKRIPIKPYEFLNPIFQKYITSDDPDVPEFKGITIYAKFVPSKDNILGRLLRQGMCARSEPNIYIYIYIYTKNAQVATSRLTSCNSFDSLLTTS